MEGADGERDGIAGTEGIDAECDVGPQVIETCEAAAGICLIEHFIRLLDLQSTIGKMMDALALESKFLEIVNSMRS